MHACFSISLHFIFVSSKSGITSHLFVVAPKFRMTVARTTVNAGTGTPFLQTQPPIPSFISVLSANLVFVMHGPWSKFLKLVPEPKKPAFSGLSEQHSAPGQIS